VICAILTGVLEEAFNENVVDSTRLGKPLLIPTR